MKRQIHLPALPDPSPYDDPIALALVAELCERDPRDVRAETIASRAGIPLADFYERFADLDACLVDSFERFIAAYEHRVGSAFNGHSDWRSGLRAAAYESAAWINEYPKLTEFGAVRVLSLENEMVRVRREELFLFCAEMIDGGREAAPDPDAVPEPAPMIAIGSILQLLTHRIQAGVSFDPVEIVPEMMYGVVRTYLGDEAAEEELNLPRDSRK